LPTADNVLEDPVRVREHLAPSSERQFEHAERHEALRPDGMFAGDGSAIVALTPRGRTRAGSIIRRHRLAERLFTDSLAMDSESEIEEQACKFEHILSPEATDKICSFLGHPRTCPHGAPIPPGPCCQTKISVETIVGAERSGMKAR